MNTEDINIVGCAYLNEIRSDFLKYVQKSYINIDFSDLETGVVSRSKLSNDHLQHLFRLFRLSEFEIRVLLISVSVELDAVVSVGFNRIGNKFRPSISFISDMYPEIAHNISHYSSLRLWSLITLQDSTCFLHSPIIIPEKVLLFMLGEITLDHILADIVANISVNSENLRPTEYLQTQWSNISAFDENRSIPLQFQSADQDECEASAMYISNQLGMALYKFSLEDFPQNSNRTWSYNLFVRELIMNHSLLWIDCNALISSEDDQKREMYNFVKNLSNRVPERIVLSAFTPLSAYDLSVEIIVLKERSAHEQVSLWQEMLDDSEMIEIEVIQKLSQQFKLSLQQTKTVAAQWNKLNNRNTNKAYEILWQLCRFQLRKITTGIHLHESSTEMKNLVMVSRAEHLLKQFLIQARNRFKVYEDWGFSNRYGRGLGLVALFTGPPGTGKTTAAEVIANELKLDLLKVDLSQMVSKYIGETEKNLESVFNIANKSGAVLLFDEADSLFNKRTEVRDSHDAHANRQISYLLQKIEMHQGITILTTNLKNAVDEAFLRRIRFVIEFEAPERDERYAIWKKIFPDKLPVKDIDYEKLSSYSLSGGEIKNSVLNAAFMAAEYNTPLTMSYLEDSVAEEFEKNEKPVMKD